ncbi:MAG: PRC-barrel domain-containing protein [Chloroflexota bacterium]|nr:PRC-barrel domain-containing protein [Chloroflexota bacterium]
MESESNALNENNERYAGATRRPANLVKLGDTTLTLGDDAQDVRGRTVLDRSGSEIGTVDDLMIDEEEVKVRFLRVGAGGFLGLGERHFLIPVDAIAQIAADQVHIDQTRERITGSPDYDPSLVAETYWNDLYGYYGYSPFWGAGYRYPLIW